MKARPVGAKKSGLRARFIAHAVAALEGQVIVGFIG